MTLPARRHLKQPVTYWAPLDTFNNEGREQLAAPILFWGRWLHERNFVRTIAGDEVETHHVVSVSQSVDIDGYLALGDWTVSQYFEQDPRTQICLLTQDVGQIKWYSEMPDLRNLSRERRAHVT
jgi:hypothetical protein